MPAQSRKSSPPTRTPSAEKNSRARAAGVGKRADWLKEIAQERQSWEQSVSELRSSNIAPLHYARICHDTGEVVAEKNPDRKSVV